MAKTGSHRNILLRTGFGRDPDGICTVTLLQLCPGPGGMGTTLSAFKGRASHNAHLLGVSCTFPKLIPCSVIHGSAEPVRGPGLQLGADTATSELPWPESG